MASPRCYHADRYSALWLMDAGYGIHIALSGGNDVSLRIQACRDPSPNHDYAVTLHQPVRAFLPWAMPHFELHQPPRRQRRSSRAERRYQRSSLRAITGSSFCLPSVASLRVWFGADNPTLPRKLPVPRKGRSPGTTIAPCARSLAALLL